MVHQNSSNEVGQQLIDLQEKFLQKLSLMSCLGHFYIRWDYIFTEGDKKICL